MDEGPPKGEFGCFGATFGAFLAYKLKRLGRLVGRVKPNAAHGLPWRTDWLPGAWVAACSGRNPLRDKALWFSVEAILWFGRPWRTHFPL